MKTMMPAEQPTAGQAINKIKVTLEGAFGEKQHASGRAVRRRARARAHRRLLAGARHSSADKYTR